jgi:hypothetical protein
VGTGPPVLEPGHGHANDFFFVSTDKNADNAGLSITTILILVGVGLVGLVFAGYMLKRSRQARKALDLDLNCTEEARKALEDIRNPLDIAELQSDRAKRVKLSDRMKIPEQCILRAVQEMDAKEMLFNAYNVNPESFFR